MQLEIQPTWGEIEQTLENSEEWDFEILLFEFFQLSFP